MRLFDEKKVEERVKKKKWVSSSVLVAAEKFWGELVAMWGLYLESGREGGVKMAAVFSSTYNGPLFWKEH